MLHHSQFLHFFAVQQLKARISLLVVEVSRSHSTGRTPLNEWSARHRGRYLHKTQHIRLDTAIPIITWLQAQSPGSVDSYMCQSERLKHMTYVTNVICFPVPGKTKATFVPVRYKKLDHEDALRSRSTVGEWSVEIRFLLMPPNFWKKKHCFLEGLFSLVSLLRSIEELLE